MKINQNDFKYLTVRVRMLQFRVTCTLVKTNKNKIICGNLEYKLPYLKSFST